MSYTQKGTISSISEISEVGTGKKLTFRIKTDDQYNPLWEFEMYKSGENVETDTSVIARKGEDGVVDKVFISKSPNPSITSPH